MRVLQFGTTGQVARSLLDLGADGAAEIVALGRARADLRDPDACAAAIMAADAPDLVVNAAAYTAVDRAESEEETARLVNADAPAAMATACARRGVPFIHLSTDYVFDGRGARPYREDDAIGPLNAYGRGKAAGEAAVAAACAAHVILRTSWVFSPYGTNFLKTMLRLGCERDRLRIVDDQVGEPTPAAAIAEAILTIGRRILAGDARWGLFHFAGAPATSWRRFAEAIFAAAGPDMPVKAAVEPIATRDYPTAAVRPLRSMLDCSRIGAAYGIEPPDWQRATTSIVRRLASQ